MKQEKDFGLYSDKLTVFFYELIRFHVPAAAIEGLVNRITGNAEENMVSGALAEYANSLAVKFAPPRLQDKATVVLEKMFDDDKEIKNDLTDFEYNLIKQSQKGLEHDHETMTNTVDDVKNSVEKLVKAGVVSRVQADKIVDDVGNVITNYYLRDSAPAVDDSTEIFEKPEMKLFRRAEEKK